MGGGGGAVSDGEKMAALLTPLGPGKWPRLDRDGDRAAVLLVVSMAETFGPERAMAMAQRLAGMSLEQWRQIADLGAEWTDALLAPRNDEGARD